MGIAPVEKTIRVRLEPADAFDLFTRQMARWWPFVPFSCSGASALRVEFEPKVGGVVVEHTKDGARHLWGTLTAWEPPHRFAMTWHPARTPEQATRLAVEFAALAGGGTEVRLTHDGWEAREAGVRENYDGGWNTVLARFIAHSEEGR
jgi:hypothetical protein